MRRSNEGQLMITETRESRTWEPGIPPGDEVRLTPEEIQRYGRHLILPEVGMRGQRQLKAARVMLIGAGGLGSPLGMYLAAAGVGTLGLVDFDVVDFSNLQRQILHGTKDVGRPKLASARDRILDINPNTHLELHETALNSENTLDILREYDIIVQGADNLPTRYLVNDACVLLGKPLVDGSILRFEGHTTVYWAERGPCYRCLFPEPPPPEMVPSCAEGGVLGILPGIVGCIQANEVVKLILGAGEPLIGRYLIFDAMKVRFRELKLRKDPECPACGEHPTVRELIDYVQFCGIQPHVETNGEADISAPELAQRLRRGDPVFLLDVRNPEEWEICRLPGAKLIPLPELPDRLNELDVTDEIVAYCKMGGRSARAVDLLKQAGFSRLRNLAGGITAWSEQVDPSVPRY
jgi:molybdopterin/thiamine biosynthesis adenylyltransferase/rhodanese-related sulfurtransferase